MLSQQNLLSIQSTPLVLPCDVIMENNKSPEVAWRILGVTRVCGQQLLSLLHLLPFLPSKRTDAKVIAVTAHSCQLIPN